MTQNTQRNITDNSGVNVLWTLVEGKGSFFREINRQDDIGFDANIEFCKNLLSTNIEIKVQIKSRSSYFNKTSSFIKGDHEHFEYWKNFIIPALG